jgi:hypothetical protein
MDGDGKLDLVGSDGDAIVVLLGNGDGTFQPPIATATPWFLTAVAVGNVIGDEALDVVVAGSSAAPSVLIFPGSGDGHFGNPVSLGSSDSTHFVLLTDLDGNGQTDVVVDDNSVPPSGAVAVYLNQGNGMFDSPGHYPASPSGLLAADLDDDGHLDLVVPGSGSTGPGSIRLLFGLGDGTFGPGVDFVGGAGPTPTVAIDVLETGLPSLVYPTAGERSISILDNRGERSFGGAPFTPTGFGGTAFVSGDFDEDGFPDLVTTFFPDFQNPDFFVLKGAGTGRFEPQTELELGQHVESLQTGHFSLSGHLDLLVQGTFGALFILSGNGDGTFGPEIGSLDSIEGSPPAIADSQRRRHRRHRRARSGTERSGPRERHHGRGLHPGSASGLPGPDRRRPLRRRPVSRPSRSRFRRE